LATAVIWAVPVDPGVHTLGAVSESQVPAQATPPLETVTTSGALDWNEKLSVIVLPAEFWAEAAKARNLPISRETSDEGVRFTTAGTSLFVTWVLLPLLHDASKAHPKRARIVVPRDVPEANLPMNAFQ
jgi:hypothetical protein